MRTEAIIVFVLVAATPAYASKSCMTMAEARQQFATSHLYWHGAGHCWDATPPRHRAVRVRPREDNQARRDNREVDSQEPKWRNAMSEMLPTDAPSELQAAPTSSLAAEPPPIDWLDRWVDVAQVASPGILSRDDEPASVLPTVLRPDQKPDPAITPVRLLLLLLVAMLAAIGLTFRNLLHDRRR
jgi:hypothetical protein